MNDEILGQGLSIFTAGIGIIKAVISAIIIWLIIKNGGEALAECPRRT